MRLGTTLLLACCLLPASAGLLPVQSGSKDKSEPAADNQFVDRVWTILQEKCLGCHGNDPQKFRGGLDLRTRPAALRGGDSGRPALVPGEPENSLLFRAITRKDPELAMPPKEKERLTDKQIGWVRHWIAQGAFWPLEKKKATWTDAADGVTVLTSGGRSPEWTRRKYRVEDLWAFQPIRRPPTPASRAGRNPIDSFIRAKLWTHGVQQAPVADPLTFLRRAAFDLTGLPPTPAEIDTFVRDDPVHRTGRLLDRLLASPHYGEQMTRHWLDVVRYADTSGYSNDFERPSAWRYRDYVIRSLNADKRFDRFVLEQVAGDELDPTNPELAIAVGYLRLGPWEHTGMSVAAVTRQDFLDDVTHHVGVTFLGLGLRCARCHDHKFDPIPTLDYYRMQAAFAPVQFAERPLPFLAGEKAAVDDGTRPSIEVRLARARAEVKRFGDKKQTHLDAWLKSRGYASLQDVPETERPNRVRFGLTDQELTLDKMWKKRSEYYERERLRFEPYVFTVYNGPLRKDYTSGKLLNPLPSHREGAAQAVHVLLGGALESPAEAVAPGTLSAVPLKGASRSALTADPWALPATMDGRRLALAKWLIAAENPLTARVIVNRVWQWHFGRALVATPNNFGKMGGRPTHPELLDWLACWFMDHGWSLKKLHQLIMTSATYQQGGRHPQMEKLRQIDPGNELLAYFPPRRLAAEEIRDALLAVSGELNLRMGGPGAFPEINWEAALQPRHLMGSPAPAYQPSPQPAQRNRRTVYCFRFRTLADPLLEVFNRPGSETSCECRDRTTVTPQALALFNSDFARNRALAFAASLDGAGGELKDKIRRAFQRTYGRHPAPKELALCLDHISRMTEYHRAHPPTRTELPAKVQRKVIQEETGKEIAWEEPLDVMAVYQRDLMPWQTTPQVRALADLCLVLLNSNEFLYVR
jgi:hypothetical protein